MSDVSTGDTATTTVTRDEVEQLTQQVEDLQAELRMVQAELAHTPRRGRGRHRHDGDDDTGGPSLVSRRRLFGLLGGAAAAGAGLAVAGSALEASPAGATGVTPGAVDGDALSLGNANTCTSLTTLTAGIGIQVTATGASANGLTGICNNGNNAFGVSGSSSTGYGVAATAAGGLAPLRLVPGSVPGPPSGSVHRPGELYVDSHGILFQCVAAGPPIVWARQSPLVQLASPVRVYDSRSGQPNVVPNVQGSLVFTNPPPTATARTITCAFDTFSVPVGQRVVPANATALLMNIAVIPVQPPVGALAVYATGTSQPGASTINWPSFIEALANGATVACNTNQQVDVAIVAADGAETDFLIDISGYYL
jgi:hypothetical protein